MAKITIMDNGKIAGFQIKETEEDRRKGRKVFVRVPLPPGISRDEVERVRSKWPQSVRHRKRRNARLDKINETYGTEAFKNRVYKSHRRVAEAADEFFDI
jgi:hypothetical protein